MHSDLPHPTGIILHFQRQVAATHFNSQVDKHLLKADPTENSLLPATAPCYNSCFYLHQE